MIHSYKGRTLNNTKPVEVYRCLSRKGKVFSVRQGGKVIGHCEKIVLKDCEFVVNESGRKRVVKTGQKNVHAYIRGYVTHFFSIASVNHGIYLNVTYNPFKNKSFMMGSSKVSKCKLLKIEDGEVRIHKIL